MALNYRLPLVHSAIIRLAVCCLPLVAGGVASFGCAEMTRIRTDPPGATVVVDGKTIGTSPVAFTVPSSELYSGRVYRYRVERQGYEPLDGEIQGAPSRARMMGMMMTAGFLYLFKGPIALPSRVDLTLRPADVPGGEDLSEVSQYPVMRYHKNVDGVVDAIVAVLEKLGYSIKSVNRELGMVSASHRESVPVGKRVAMGVPTFLMGTPVVMFREIEIVATPVANDTTNVKAIVTAGQIMMTGKVQEFASDDESTRRYWAELFAALDEILDRSGGDAPDGGRARSSLPPAVE